MTTLLLTAAACGQVEPDNLAVDESAVAIAPSTTLPTSTPPIIAADDPAELSRPVPRLVGSWTFDEGRGQIAHDGSGYGNDGTFGNEEGDDPRDPTWVPEEGAVRQNEWSRIKVPLSPSLRPRHLTLEIWLKDCDDRQLLAITAGSLNQNLTTYGLWAGKTDGGVDFFISTDQGQKYAPGIAPERLWDGQWHQVVESYDGAFLKTYLDGALVAEPVPFTGKLLYPQGPLDDAGFWIGSALGTDVSSFNGLMDDVRIYNEALSDAEIAANAAAGRVKRDALPVELTTQVGPFVTSAGVPAAQIAGTPAMRSAHVSVEATVQSTDPGERTIVAKGVDAAGPTYALRRAANRYEFAVRTTAGVARAVASETTTDASWHRLSGTYDGEAACLYVDGERQGCATAAGELVHAASGGEDLYIGGGPGQPSLEGTVRDVAVYDQALARTEIVHAEPHIIIGGAGAGSSPGEGEACKASDITWSSPTSTSESCAAGWQYREYNKCYVDRADAACPVDHYDPVYTDLPPFCWFHQTGGRTAWSFYHPANIVHSRICLWPDERNPSLCHKWGGYEDVPVFPDCNGLAASEFNNMVAHTPPGFAQFLSYTVSKNFDDYSCTTNITSGSFPLEWQQIQGCPGTPIRTQTGTTPVYRSCRAESHGRDPGHCGTKTSYGYSLPALSMATLESTVGDDGWKDVDLAEKTCFSGEQLPMGGPTDATGTKAQAKAKYAFIQGKLAQTLPWASPAGSRAALVAALKQIFELKGDAWNDCMPTTPGVLTPEQKLILDLYESDPAARVGCGAPAWTPFATEATCPGAGRVNALLTMCHRMLEDHVSSEVALLAFDRCDKVADLIDALPEAAACKKRDYFLDYANMDTDLVTKSSSATGICPAN